MTTTLPPRLLPVLLPDLRLAGLRLAEARTAFEHSPNAGTQAGLDFARTRMNVLLDTLLDVR
jgi:hypothetical protein